MAPPPGPRSRRSPACTPRVGRPAPHCQQTDPGGPPPRASRCPPCPIPCPEGPGPLAVSNHPKEGPPGDLDVRRGDHDLRDGIEAACHAGPLFPAGGPDRSLLVVSPNRRTPDGLSVPAASSTVTPSNEAVSTDGWLLSSPEEDRRGDDPPVQPDRRAATARLTASALMLVDRIAVSPSTSCQSLLLM